MSQALDPLTGNKRLRGICKKGSILCPRSLFHAKKLLFENRKAIVSRTSQEGEVPVTTLCVFVQT